MKTDLEMQLLIELDQMELDMNKSIVATPHDWDALYRFMDANKGSSDPVLTQMAVQFGYKIAIDEVRKYLGFSK